MNFINNSLVGRRNKKSRELIVMRLLDVAEPHGRFWQSKNILSKTKNEVKKKERNSLYFSIG